MSGSVQHSSNLFYSHISFSSQMTASSQGSCFLGKAAMLDFHQEAEVVVVLLQSSEVLHLKQLSIPAADGHRFTRLNFSLCQIQPTRPIHVPMRWSWWRFLLQLQSSPPPCRHTKSWAAEKSSLERFCMKSIAVERAEEARRLETLTSMAPGCCHRICSNWSKPSPNKAKDITYQREG
ncbi:hypothetical protein ATANTOWER_005249 [Ataeniobius toweri]|uniref:Uncharacterized protein n=1 Tax=Ataeniobius toweri TaxID=208326 RepID=A0ABU7ADG9_9TELE|nr:hypothetical protein [Ataeniobius toweri]